MESDVGSTNQLFFVDPVYHYPGGWSYLRSFPGVLRLINVGLGLVTLILILLGFANDFTDESIEDKLERRHKSRYRLTYDGYFDSFEYNYGYGYVTEGPNVVQLISVVLCLLFSAFFLLCLVTCPDCHTSSRASNRFLNLSAAILQSIGLMNGMSGLLLFRSYCCHVYFGSNERHRSELEGYFREPCLCYFSPSWERSWKEYSSLYYQDVPYDIDFRSALPHHFIPHAIALCLMSLNMVAYLAASIRI